MVRGSRPGVTDICVRPIQNAICNFLTVSIELGNAVTSQVSELVVRNGYTAQEVVALLADTLLIWRLFTRVHRILAMQDATLETLLVADATSGDATSGEDD